MKQLNEVQFVLQTFALGVTNKFTHIIEEVR